MKKKWIILFFIAAFIALNMVYSDMRQSHTFVLQGDAVNSVRTQQIQPVWGKVSVSGDCDTSVIFTDTENGEIYLVGYITPGLSEKIGLPKERWYTVEGAGDITLSMVNVRIP